MPASAHRRRLVVMTKNGQNPAYAGARSGAHRVARDLAAPSPTRCPKSPMTWTSSMHC